MTDETTGILPEIQADTQGGAPADFSTGTATNTPTTSSRPPAPRIHTQSAILVQIVVAALPVMTSRKTLEPKELINCLRSRLSESLLNLGTNGLGAQLQDSMMTEDMATIFASPRPPRAFPLEQYPSVVSTEATPASQIINCSEMQEDGFTV